MATTCFTGNCINSFTLNGSYCVLHECRHPTCHNKVHNVANSPYCIGHINQFYKSCKVPLCDQKVNLNDFCTYHTCSEPKCQIRVEDTKTICSLHIMHLQSQLQKP
jgi:hypothetical protein